MARILMKVINVFPGENLVIHGNQHSRHPRKYKKQKLQNKMKPKMESTRRFKAQAGQKTENQVDK